MKKETDDTGVTIRPYREKGKEVQPDWEKRRGEILWKEIERMRETLSGSKKKKPKPKGREKGIEKGVNGSMGGGVAQDLGEEESPSRGGRKERGKVEGIERLKGSIRGGEELWGTCTPSENLREEKGPRRGEVEGGKKERSGKKRALLKSSS